MLRRHWLNRVGLALTAAASNAQRLPDRYHDQIDGDPPYLSQTGWHPLLNGRDLGGWHGLPGTQNDWFTTTAVHWNRVFSPTRLTGTPTPGDRIVNGPMNKTANLVSNDRFGSFELYLEFMTAKGSNSGIYLHGLYEVQIFDSYGWDGVLTLGDCGGIYEHADSTGGNPPSRNACRAPGEWQALRIWFAAPKFTAAGKKSQNARALRVLLNNISVQEDVEVTGPTRSSMDIAEAAENPLMLQGDHSAIAYRNIYIRPL